MKPFPFPLPLLLDGATGTMLQSRGMPAGVCSETWNLEHPEIISQVQSLYVRAGSDAILAPTFTCNSLNLSQHGVTGRTRELNRALVDLTRTTVGEKTLVGVDMTATGLLLEPYGTADFEQLYQLYYEQAQALADAGGDFFIMETTTHLAEARAAVLACKAVSQKPVFVSFTCAANGRTFCGTDVVAAMVTLQAMGVDAFGLNCSAGPEQLLPQLQRMSAYAGVPLIAKPNAGLPETVDGKTVYPCAPEEFVALVPDMARAGVRLFGGCCGTTEAHIAALRQAVDALTLAPLEDHRPQGMLTCEREIFPAVGELEKTEPLEITEDFADDAMDAEEDELLQVVLDSRQALEYFREGCHGVHTPLCILAQDGELLEQALRAYQGLAACPGDCGIAEEELQRLHRTYGLVLL